VRGTGAAARRATLAPSGDRLPLTQGPDSFTITVPLLEAFAMAVVELA
jgi:hypothetical protein